MLNHIKKIFSERTRLQDPEIHGPIGKMRVDGQQTNISRPSMFQTGKGRSLTVSEESLRRVDSLFSSQDQSEYRESRSSASEGSFPLLHLKARLLNLYSLNFWNLK